MTSLIMKQGEAKTITFTVTDSDAAAVDCSSTTCSFIVAKKKGGTAIISKADGDFDKTSAATGVLTITISGTESNIDDSDYLSELKITFTSSNIDKSEDIVFNIKKSID